jgi:hypothetical protein
MRTLILALGILVAAAAGAVAGNVTCPNHDYASCYNTGETRNTATGKLMWRWKCSCGDSVWTFSQ